jgi:hypothetical protein
VQIGWRLEDSPKAGGPGPLGNAGVGGERIRLWPHGRALWAKLKQVLDRLGTAEEPQMIGGLGQDLMQQSLLLRRPLGQTATIGLNKLHLRTLPLELIGQPIAPPITTNDENPLPAPRLMRQLAPKSL